MSAYALILVLKDKKPTSHIFGYSKELTEESPKTTHIYLQQAHFNHHLLSI
mgnify:CR=1 FL=1|jgi:hypothetical protein